MPIGYHRVDWVNRGTSLGYLDSVVYSILASEWRTDRTSPGSGG